MNALKLIGAFGLTLAALASAQAAPTQTTLRQSAGGSDLFSRTADGSAQRSELAIPAFPEQAPVAAPNSGLSTGRASTAPRAEVPSSDFSAGTAAAPAPLHRDPLVAAGFLGTGLFLAIGAMFLRHAGPTVVETTAAAPETYAIDPVISALATPGARAPRAAASVFAEPAAVPAPVSVVTAPRFVPAADAAYVDARMPVRTWRAISRQEQALIESWNVSREKALGQASLEQWLERHPSAGVDVAALQAKLARA